MACGNNSSSTSGSTSGTTSGTEATAGTSEGTSGTSATDTRPPPITKKPTTLQPQAIPQNLPSKYFAAQLAMKEEWKEAYKQPKSAEYGYLKGLVESSLHDFLAPNLRGFRSVRVRKFE